MYNLHKLITAVLVTLLSLNILPNIIHAESKPDKTDKTRIEAIKTWHRIQAIKNKTKQKSKKQLQNLVSPLTLSIQTGSVDATSVEYQGEVSNTQQNEYALQVASPSQVQISSVISNTKLDYFLVGTDDSGATTFYSDGDTLPAGDYTFTVFADSDTPINYDYVLSGLSFAQQPDTTLPKFTFTNPSLPISRLTQNTTSLQFTGTTDTQTDVTNNESFSQQFNGDFDFNVPLHAGNNYVDFQAVTASGNATYIDLTLVVPTIKRIDGPDRFAVAANVAQEMPPSDTVVIASGLNDKFADALSGSSLAGLYQAPILMTSQKTLPTATVDEINRRGPTQAIIMGGTGTVDPAIETQLKSLGIQTITRIDGANRFAVSVNAAKQLQSVLGPQTGDGVLVASGMVFPDALSASTVASDSLTPILLVSSTGVPTEVQTYLQSNPSINQMTVVGGSVPQAAIDKLKSLGDQVTIINGSDRYAVNLNLAKVFDADLSDLVFAVGTKFPDALSGGPFASSITATLSPLFLTPTDQLPADLKTYLDSNKAKIQVIYILGGTDSVSDTVATQLDQYVQ